jgi:hypothetical protein
LANKGIQRSAKSKAPADAWRYVEKMKNKLRIIGFSLLFTATILAVPVGLFGFRIGPIDGIISFLAMALFSVAGPFSLVICDVPSFLPILILPLAIVVLISLIIWLKERNFKNLCLRLLVNTWVGFGSYVFSFWAFMSI